MSFKAQESLSDQVAIHFAKEIIVGDLLAGDRIQEVRYAKELEVSRGTIREALLILERWHLIQILPRRGAVVTDMSEEHVNSLYEIVSVLMVQLVRKAVQIKDEDTWDPFFALIHEMQQYVDERMVEEFHDVSFRFFSALYPLAQNHFLEDTLENLQPAVRRSYYLAIHVDRQEMLDSLAFFKAILESMIRGDKTAAEEVIEGFFDQQRQLVLQSIIRQRQLEVAWSHRYRRGGSK